MDILYYDGNCPLCLREIRTLKKLRDDRLQMINAHKYEPAGDEPDRQAMLLRLHMRTSDGEWISGVDATVRAWAHTRWGFAFKILRWPLIGSVADSAYRYWARKRYQRLYGCDVCIEAD